VNDSTDVGVARRPRGAGRQLRFDLDLALTRAGRELGQSLEWSEQESQVIDRAVAAADRAEVLGRSWKKEIAGEARPSVLVKLSAEMRACERAVVDLVARVNPGVRDAKSDRHQRAAQSRWGRQREAGA
jgi:hypothetical protein